MQAVDEGHVVADHVGHRRKQVPGLHHDVDRLLGVAEHRDAGVAGHRLLAPLELPGLAVGLQRRDDLLGHLLEVRHLIEADHVPDHHHALLPAGHVPEQVGHGGGAGQQRSVGGELLHRVALAGAAGTELNQVEVALAERNEPGEEEELQASLHHRGLVAHASGHQVQPLVAGELPTQAPELLEVESRELDGGELLDPERVFALGLLVVLPAHVDLGPDPARQQPVEIPHVVIGDVDVAVAEVGHLSPVMGVHQAHFDLIDEGVAALLLDPALSLLGLVRADVVVGERVVDDLQPHLDRHLVRGCAVFAKQVLEHEDGDIGPDLHLAHQVLAHHPAGEGAVDLVVEGVPGRDLFACHDQIPSLTGISSD